MPNSSSAGQTLLSLLARLIPTIFAFSVFELILSVMNYPGWVSQNPVVHSEPHPILGWQNKEGQFRLRLTGDIKEFTYTFLKNGRRRNRLSDENFTRKVAIVGDSFVQGFGLPDEQSFPWLLQSEFPQVGIENYGTAGYGTYQSFLKMEEIAAAPDTKPDTYIYFLNDFHEDRNVSEKEWSLIFRIPPKSSGYFLPYVFLESGELKKASSFGPAKEALLFTKVRTIAFLKLAYAVATKKSHVEKFEVMSRLLSKMKELAARDGAEFIVVLFDMVPANKKQYQEFLSSNHFLQLDCDSPHRLDAAFMLPDRHPNFEMNKVIAQCIKRGAQMISRSFELDSSTKTR